MSKNWMTHTLTHIITGSYLFPIVQSALCASLHFVIRSASSRLSDLHVTKQSTSFSVSTDGIDGTVGRRQRRLLALDAVATSLTASLTLHAATSAQISLPGYSLLRRRRASEDRQPWQRPRQPARRTDNYHGRSRTLTAGRRVDGYRRAPTATDGRSVEQSRQRQRKSERRSWTRTRLSSSCPFQSTWWKKRVRRPTDVYLAVRRVGSDRVATSGEADWLAALFGHWCPRVSSSATTTPGLDAVGRSAPARTKPAIDADVAVCWETAEYRRSWRRVWKCLVASSYHCVCRSVNQTTCRRCSRTPYHSLLHTHTQSHSANNSYRNRRKTLFPSDVPQTF